MSNNNRQPSTAESFDDTDTLAAIEAAAAVPNEEAGQALLALSRAVIAAVNEVDGQYNLHAYLKRLSIVFTGPGTADIRLFERPEINIQKTSLLNELRMLSEQRNSGRWARSLLLDNGQPAAATTESARAHDSTCRSTGKPDQPAG